MLKATKTIMINKLITCEQDNGGFVSIVSVVGDHLTVDYETKNLV